MKTPIEEKVRSYYKGARKHASVRMGGRDRALMEICRRYKLPMAQVKEILGIIPRLPWPTPRPHNCEREYTGNCLGQVMWYEVDREWSGRCRVHYPGYEYYERMYGDKYVEFMEEDHKHKRYLTK